MIHFKETFLKTHLRTFYWQVKSLSNFSESILCKFKVKKYKNSKKYVGEFCWELYKRILERILTLFAKRYVIILLFDGQFFFFFCRCLRYTNQSRKNTTPYSLNFTFSWYQKFDNATWKVMLKPCVKCCLAVTYRFQCKLY